MRIPIRLEEDVKRWLHQEKKYFGLIPPPMEILHLVGCNQSEISRLMRSHKADKVRDWRDRNIANLGWDKAYEILAFLFSTKLAQLLMPIPSIGKPWYENLDVEPNASYEEAKRAYRQRCREWHPDLNGEALYKSGYAHEATQALNLAWEQFEAIAKRAE